MLQETKVSRQSNETFKNSDIITFHPNFVLKGTTKDGCIWLLDFQSKSMVNNLAGSRLYDVATSYKANTVANWYNRLTINRLLGWFNTEWAFNVCVYIHDLVRSSIPCGPSGVGAGRAVSAHGIRKLGRGSSKRRVIACTGLRAGVSIS